MWVKTAALPQSQAKIVSSPSQEGFANWTSRSWWHFGLAKLLETLQNEIQSNPYSGWMSSTHSTIQVLKDQQLVATELSHPPLKCTSAPLRVSLSYSISTSSYSVQLSGVGLIRGFTTKKLKFLNPECATSTSGSILRSHFPTQQSTHLETSSNRQLQFEVEAERKDRN